MTAAAPPPERAIADLEAHVRALRCDPSRRDELVDLLLEESPVYAGLPSEAAERLRGFVLASFEHTGLPPAALAHVLEELEIGADPYAVAGAARALRRADNLPAAAAALLVTASQRLRASEDFVQFEALANPGDRSVSSASAVSEIICTLSHLQGRARSEVDAADGLCEPPSGLQEVRDPTMPPTMASVQAEPAAATCCCGPPPALSDAAPCVAGSCATISDFLVQDQNGAEFTFGDFFAGRPSILTFFYTRCMNPAKCSLNVTKLARLQRGLMARRVASDINVAAITYDPGFDRPDRLRIYGHDRGMRFDPRNKLLRGREAPTALQRYFELGVGFGPANVNRHRIELFVLDRATEIQAAYRRAPWREEDVVGVAMGLLG